MAPHARLPAYKDPEYQSTHLQTFENSLTYPLRPVLPPNVKQSEFDIAIAEYKSAVGSTQVLTGEDLVEYIDPYELHESDASKRKVPSAAVRPANVDELKKVLEVSNKHVIPLWTFSRGKNLGYGGPAPRVTGSVALDLHRMDKIIEVSEEYSYAVVEPGVTFTDLYEHCAKNKLKVWPSVPSLGWGSVVGNVSLSVLGGLKDPIAICRPWTDTKYDRRHSTVAPASLQPRRTISTFVASRSFFPTVPSFVPANSLSHHPRLHTSPNSHSVPVLKAFFFNPTLGSSPKWGYGLPQLPRLICPATSICQTLGILRQ